VSQGVLGENGDAFPKLKFCNSPAFIRNLGASGLRALSPTALCPVAAKEEYIKI
jgi:hypothetical protein